MNKLLLLCTAATIVAPTAALAQSTGSVDFEKDVIVVTGTRANNGVSGVVVPDSTKAKAVITQELIARQNPGQTILNTINLVPSVNFTNNDPYGGSGGNIRIRGFDGNRISLTFDGIPLNDSGNYAIFAGQQLDPEVIEEVNVNLGVTDVDSPTASAAGGTVNYRSLIPSKTPGVRVSGSIGDFGYHRIFGLLQTGTLTSFGTRAWVSGSYAKNDKFKGPGKIEKSQFNGKIYQPLGTAGDFIALAGHYNENRNNFYRNPSITDLRGTFGSTVVPATASPDAPIFVGDYNDTQQNALFAFENLAKCNRTVGGRGVQNDNGGTGPNGTLPADAAINGSTANNPANSSSCSNFYGVRINPSNTGNIRGSSRFTLAQGLVLTVDPSYQYVLANGGGSTAFNEFDAQLKGSATTSAGVDLNRDGDTLDRIRLLTPNNTNTHRFGLTSSLIWDIGHNHRVRVAYTYDRAKHRQTGEYGYLLADGRPFNNFGGRGEGPVLDAAGNILQQRDRTSIALLNQVAGQYVGWFMERKLRVEAGVRRPFFQRNLDQHCYTFASGSGFAYCTSQVLGATPIALPANGNYVVPANFVPALGAQVPTNAVYAPFKAKYKFGKLLPNVGATFKFTPEVSMFASYAKGFSAPRTDNLYRRPVVQVTPEETNAFDVGLRYTSRQVQAQVTLWDIGYKNRIVSSYDPDLGISLDRNVGRVKSKGVDASIAFKPIKQLSLLAIASYIDAKLQQNVEIGSVKGVAVQPALPVGTIYCAGAPTAIGQVVTTCAPTAGKRVTETPKLQYGGRIGLEFGPVSMGLQGKYVGKRFATDTNDVVSKGYATVDFDARVSAKPLGLEKTYFQFNVINITNRFYFGNISTQINAAGNPNFSIGSPRTFIGTLNVGF
ncbi:TonB-dependent receptor domain-containing protein [Sphingomonas sp.]|uniref:TonB-dependent receptor n=1 Tax=Sphingomonas sp. TaxID=28214 RepID=UPI00286D4F7A|nr:TonB-dependent receptor [Sphingomonas sp.]